MHDKKQLQPLFPNGVRKLNREYITLFFQLHIISIFILYRCRSDSDIRSLSQCFMGEQERFYIKRAHRLGIQERGFTHQGFFSIMGPQRGSVQEYTSDHQKKKYILLEEEI